MLGNAKYIYALDMWTVEKRPNRWYFSKSCYHGHKHDWRGPWPIDRDDGGRRLYSTCEAGRLELAAA